MIGQLPQQGAMTPDQRRREAVERAIKERAIERAKRDAAAMAGEEDESMSSKATRYLREGVAIWGLELPDFSDPNIDNGVADTTDLPKHWMWGSFILYQLAFYGLAAYFFAAAYMEGRTSSFITLDKASGVCVDDSKSTSCCEVPVTITGTFRASSQGLWDTMSGFDFVKNNYMATMVGVHYTNEQWTKIMKNIVVQMQAIGLKGTTRDFSWNMVAWASYTAIDTSNGHFQFYTTADVGVMFMKDIIAIGYASNRSDEFACKPVISTSMGQLDRVLTINTDLNIGGWACTTPPCIDNPCPGILAPQLMGYDTKYASTSIMTWKLDMASVITALSVNMGILPLSTLTEVKGDNDRIGLLNNMYNLGYISMNDIYNTSSYFDTLYAPMNSIYCTKYFNTTAASCYIRQGDMLMYPVISHYGWSESGLDYPTQCTTSNAGAGRGGTAAFYYCNRFDLAVGLIYYPVNNIDLDQALKDATRRPTFSPTLRPTPLPGSPTWKPTARPSARPSLTMPPTREPTNTRYPTFSMKPTYIPTNRPTPLPGNPTRKPTFSPTTRAPTLSQAPSYSLKPTVSSKPTTLPTWTQSPSFSFKPTATPTITFAPTTSSKPTTSFKPTQKPTLTIVPTTSYKPTVSYKPTRTPTLTIEPTTSYKPTVSYRPTRVPTLTIEPTVSYKPTVSFRPTRSPTFLPSEAPTVATLAPSNAPVVPTFVPSASPSEAPSVEPSEAPVVATLAPSAAPTTSAPSAVPGAPTDEPTEAPSDARRRLLKQQSKKQNTQQRYPMSPLNGEHFWQHKANAPRDDRLAEPLQMNELSDAAIQVDNVEVETTPTDPGTTPTDPGTNPTDPGTNPTDPGTFPESYYTPSYYYENNNYYPPSYGEYSSYYGSSYGGSGSYDYYYIPSSGSGTGSDTDDAWWNLPEETSEGVEEPVVDASLVNIYAIDESLFSEYVAPADDYAAGVSQDDFIPSVQENIDNGKIFAFGKDAAMKLHASANGDLYVVTKSYKALIDTIVGTPAPGSSFKKDFATLGKGSANTPVPGGMAMLAFEVFGGDNREVSPYAFQPGITPAFYNTFYNARTMFLLSKYPPTMLIETYYTCVLSQWNSFYNAAGLANSNVQLYLTVAFMVYMYLVVFYHTKVRGEDIQFKSVKEKEEAKLEEQRQEVLDEVIQHFSVMRYRFDALVEDTKAGDKDLSGFNMAILMSEIKDLDAMPNSASQIMEVVGGDKGIDGDIELSETGYTGAYHPVVSAEDIKDFDQVNIADAKTDDNV